MKSVFQIGTEKPKVSQQAGRVAVIHQAAFNDACELLVAHAKSGIDLRKFVRVDF